jgi:methionine aminopeptidase
MAKSSAAAQLENFNQRLVRTEQILPTLATKDDLQRAIEPLATKEALRLAIERAIEPLATKEDLRRAIERAVEPLATKEALQRAIEPLATKAELLEMRDELRRHMDVQTEALRSDIRLLAEYVEHLASKIAEE